MRTSLVGLAFLIAACSGVSTHSVPLNGTSQGCGDAILYLISADNGTVLSLDWPGAASGTWEANDTQKTMTGLVGHKGLEVRMQVGRNLGQMVCNDVVELDPVVETEYSGVSGTVVMTLTIDQDPRFPTAEARISDLVLTAEDGTMIRAKEVIFQPATVGWYAG